VIGVDTSPEMLGVAREKVPAGEFYEADLHDVPLADGSVDLVVCAIALSHVADLARALREFVRVLRPNGHLVISEQRKSRRDHLALPAFLGLVAERIVVSARRARRDSSGRQDHNLLVG
jgi:ubiquinone/menaquinone biosynthesis C-methylase UbiE